jgi:Fe-S-cluster containining protein
MTRMASLCDQCSALCCRYFALEIDKPTTAEDYDNIRWYLVHENVVVYIHKKRWYLGILTRCKHLQEDNRCGIYKTRPRICRQYSTDNCDYHGGEYDFDVLFTSAEQLREYAEKKLGRSILPRSRKRRRKLKLRPNPRPVAIRSVNGNGLSLAVLPR